MRSHGNCENRLNWNDRYIPYTQLASVLIEATAGFAHLYAFGDSKCTLISHLFGLPVYNLENFNCLSPRYFRPEFGLPNPVTEIRRSFAPQDTLIRSMSG
jgi:hypothetical protein